MGHGRGIREIATFDCAGSGQVVVEGGYAYLGHMRAPAGTTIVDVRDPKRPRQVAHVEMPPGTHSHKVRVSGDIMVVNHEINGNDKSPVPSASISREATRAVSKVPEDRFTGNVRVAYLFPANAPASATGGQVMFDAGARTAWHAHPMGQTLIVTAGAGRVQFWGGPIQEIKPGDVVWIPPGQKHWHGAAPATPMTHIAIQEQVDGQTAEWLEKVTDEQYNTP